MQTPPTTPDYHFLLFSPGLETWIFRTAHAYWTAFRPILYSMKAPDDTDLVKVALEERGISVAVTLIMRRDTTAQVRTAITEQLPGIYLDPLVYDTPTDLQLTLNGRAAYNQRFGVPS